jgi:hypothetical protein
MAQIGTIACTYVHTPQGSIPAALRMESAVWRVAGLAGYGIALVGLGGGDFTVTAVLLSSNAAVSAWAAAIQALQGTIVSITDDHANSFSGCYLEIVSNVLKSAAYIPGGITTRGQIEIRGKKLV